MTSKLRKIEHAEYSITVQQGTPSIFADDRRQEKDGRRGTTDIISW